MLYFAMRERKNLQQPCETLHLTNKYDLIFIPFNSIHHLYQNQDLFDTLKVVNKLYTQIRNGLINWSSEIPASAYCHPCTPREERRL